MTVASGMISALGGSPTRRFDQPNLKGEDGSLHSVSEAQLGQDLPDVRFDRGLGDEELSGYFGIGETFGHGDQHLTFAIGEFLEFADLGSGIGPLIW